MSEEEQKMTETEKEPKFPYPYPTARCIGSIFLVYFITRMAPLWGSGKAPDWLLAAGMAVCAVLAFYLCVTGYKGQLVRRNYALEKEAVRREQARAQMKAEEEAEKAAKKAAAEAAGKTAEEAVVEAAEEAPAEAE